MNPGSVCCAGDSQPHGEGHGDLRGGAGGHRHHAESGVAHQRHEEEARARREAAGMSVHAGFTRPSEQVGSHQEEISLRSSSLATL